MEKPLSNSPSMPFYAMNHRITYVAAYLESSYQGTRGSYQATGDSYQATRGQDQFDYIAIQVPLNFTLIVTQFRNRSEIRL